MEKMNNKNIKLILDALKELYPDYQIQLKYSSPFQLLIAVVLSAQTTDKQVNKVTNVLFQIVRKPEDILSLWFEKLRKILVSVGFYNNKAKNLINLSSALLKLDIAQNSHLQKSKKIYKKYGYVIPDSLEDLQKLPWVGEKTAKVVLSCLYGDSVVPVDTHIHRIVNRIWLVQTKDPSQTSKQLEKIIDKDSKKFAHYVLIAFGRNICKAKNPLCQGCPFSNFCDFYNKN